MGKRGVYMVQVNHAYGRSAFLPYSAGLLQAYALSDPRIREHYDFKGFVFLREPIGAVVERLENPDVVALSCYIWNFHYTTALGRAIKAKFPDCLMVLGGPHVPVKDDDFLRRHDWADLLVRYEGETAFAEVLRVQLNGGREFSAIRGIGLRGLDGGVINTPCRDRVTDLDTLPSPYLSGVFDRLLDGRYDFQATQETHRGCPFSCT